MTRTRTVFACFALSILVALSAPPIGAADETASSVKGDLLFWITDAEDKLGQLIEATPAERFSWRPADGVRTTAEVFMHVAAANFGVPSFWGVAPPEGFKFEGYEQSVTSKSDIKQALAKSFAHVKKSLDAADEATLTKKIKLFGEMELTIRGAYMLLLSHAHEHLGQSIAYARSNGIVPPWTAAQQARIEAAKADAKKKAQAGGHGDHKH
jgi:uncharacterized damage-inducible protein DinB